MGKIYCALSFRYMRIYQKGDVSAWAEVWAMDLCSTLSISACWGQRGVAGEPTLPRESGDRLACRRNQECSISFSCTIYACKKLVFHK